MLNERATPPTLAQWCQRLDEHALPVLPVCLEALNRAVRRNDTSLHEIGNIIASDPVMNLRLQRECLRQFGKRLQDALGNTQHCVTLLGIDKLQILARTFTPLPAPLDTHLHYLQAMGEALLSADHARRWLAPRHPAGADAATLACHLLGMVDASLGRIAPQEAKALQVLTRQEAIPPDEADRAVLGCTRLELAHALARRWQLPELVLDALQPAELPSPAFLLRQARLVARMPGYKMPNKDDKGHYIRTPGLSLQLARGLTALNLQGGYSQAQQRLHSVLAACLFMTPEDTRRLNNDTILILSRHWPIPLLAPPACSLLWPLAPRQRRRITRNQLPQAVARLLGGHPLPVTSTAPPAARPAPAKPIKPVRPAPEPPPKPEAPPAPVSLRPVSPPKIGLASTNLPPDLDRASILGAPLPGANPPGAIPSSTATSNTTTPNEAPRFAGFKSLEKKQVFEKFLQQLLADTRQQTSEADILRALAEQLYDSTHLVRVVVARYNKPLDQLEAWYALGCDPYPLLRQFRIKLQPSNLFTHLIRQPAALWLSPERPNKAAGLLPGVFKQATQTDTGFLMSIHNHNGPCALLYADRGVNDRIGLSQHEYDVFKTACGACSKHLIAKGRQTRPNKPE